MYKYPYQVVDSVDSVDSYFQIAGEKKNMLQFNFYLELKNNYPLSTYPQPSKLHLLYNSN